MTLVRLFVDNIPDMVSPTVRTSASALLPTRIITDSLSNQRVASGNGTSTNSRHFLLRYELLLEHVQAGHLDIVYTTDAENPADYLSKFVPPAKQLTSARYSAGRATAAAGFVAAAG